MQSGSLYAISRQLDPVLRYRYATSAGKVKVSEGSGEAEMTEHMRAFEKLCSMLKKVQVPLVVQSDSSTAPALRFSDVSTDFYAQHNVRTCMYLW